MSQSDQEKWDARYREGAYTARNHPSALLAEWLGELQVPPQPCALDAACGLGRNAIYLAQMGWRVDAIDISRVGLAALSEKAQAQGLSIVCRQMDLDDWKRHPEVFSKPRYDLVVLVRYADLSLVEPLSRTLKPGGYLLAEKHLATSARVIGPTSPRFRVAAGALRQACSHLDNIFYHEGLVDDPDGRTAALAQCIARRPAD